MDEAARRAMAARHPDIPQDTLPLDWPAPVPVGRPTHRSPKSIRRAECPTCTGRSVAVDLDGHGVEVLRRHYITYRSAAVAIPCSASGRPAPPLEPTDQEPPMPIRPNADWYSHTPEEAGLYERRHAPAEERPDPSDLACPGCEDCELGEPA